MSDYFQIIPCTDLDPNDYVLASNADYSEFDGFSSRCEISISNNYSKAYKLFYKVAGNEISLVGIKNAIIRGFSCNLLRADPKSDVRCNEWHFGDVVYRYFSEVFNTRKKFGSRECRKLLEEFSNELDLNWDTKDIQRQTRTFNEFVNKMRKLHFANHFKRYRE